VFHAVDDSFGEKVLVVKRKSAKIKSRRKKTVVPDKGLYTLEVCLVGGPVADEFLEKNPVVSRTIEIRADQTLAELHMAIFKAFDRAEQHMYEFQVGGKGPQDPTAQCYVVPMAMKDTFGGSKPAGDVTRTRLGSIGLQVDDAFGYWFDFGDDWWHQINVVDIQTDVPKGTYPRVTKRVGESPPQHDDWDEDEDKDVD
jgi:Plasmid pRiA4b ORF-3-like protein